MPLVDIIVRSKNGHDMFERLVDSIEANTDPSLFRFVISDDGSDPPLPFAPRCPDVFLHTGTCNGAVTATNLGLAVALTKNDSEYVLIMDNDTEIPDGDTEWLNRMIAEFEQGGPKTACVAATSDRVDMVQQILMVPPTFTADWEDEATGRMGSKDNRAVPSFVSFCVLFRKSVLREVGPWDERYNPGNWEDTDYAVQVRNAGYEIRVARSVFIHHKSHATFGDDIQKLLKENQAKFAEKWGLGRLWDMNIIPSKEIAILAGRQAGILKEQ